MFRYILLITIFFCLNLFSQNSSENPNFIFILADDQGWNGTSVEMISGLKESKSDFYETLNTMLANQMKIAFILLKNHTNHRFQIKLKICPQATGKIRGGGR